MKFVTFLKDNEERIGLSINNSIYDLSESALWLNLDLPSKMNDFLNGGDIFMNQAYKVYEAILNKNITSNIELDEMKLLAPVPHPTSCRDGYAFRQHVAAARKNRGVEMIKEFDEFPIFYFTNHNSIYGPGNISVEKDHLLNLDFELEAAIVIGKKGKNIKVTEADSYIAGYMIMNDFSARYLQMQEMKLNLGPAKGKDFATSIGPYLVTPDDLEDYKIETEFGNKYDLEMKAYHNGSQVSQGNLKDMTFTFAEIIERASYGVELYPGDIIGSGTCGTGCYLELNGTWTREAKEKGESFTSIWLNEGDVIELEIGCLGRLSNTIIKTNDYSIIEKNKNAAL